MGECWQIKITGLTSINKQTTKIKWSLSGQRNEPAEAEELLNYF